jgi:hypothetical protein
MIATRIFGFSARDGEVRAVSKASLAPIIRCGPRALAGQWHRNKVSGRIELCWHTVSARRASVDATEPPRLRHRKGQTCNAVTRNLFKVPSRHTMRGACA